MGALTLADVLILDRKLMTGLTISDPLNNIVIVQNNKIKHIINCLQIERFVCFVGHNIIIFFAQHSRTRRKKRDAILQIYIQDRDYRAISLSWLYYCKKMLLALLTNICTALDIINCAWSTTYEIITGLKNKLFCPILLILVDK